MTAPVKEKPTSSNYSTKDIEFILEKLFETTPVDEEKIAQFKQAIKNGYVINSENIAKKILAEKNDKE